MTTEHDDLRERLRASPLVANTYCVNEKDPHRGYERRWRLHVMWADGKASLFNGPDNAGSEGVYRDALTEVERRERMKENSDG